MHDNAKLALFTTEGHIRRLYRAGTVEEKQAQVDRVFAGRKGWAGLRAMLAGPHAGRLSHGGSRPPGPSSRSSIRYPTRSRHDPFRFAHGNQHCESIGSEPPRDPRGGSAHLTLNIEGVQE